MTDRQTDIHEQLTLCSDEMYVFITKPEVPLLIAKSVLIVFPIPGEVFPTVLAPLYHRVTYSKQINNVRNTNIQ